MTTGARSCIVDAIIHHRKWRLVVTGASLASSSVLSGSVQSVTRLSGPNTKNSTPPNRSLEKRPEEKQEKLQLDRYKSDFRQCLERSECGAYCWLKRGFINVESKRVGCTVMQVMHSVPGIDGLWYMHYWPPVNVNIFQKAKMPVWGKKIDVEVDIKLWIPASKLADAHRTEFGKFCLVINVTLSTASCYCYLRTSQREEGSCGQQRTLFGRERERAFNSSCFDWTPNYASHIAHAQWEGTTWSQCAFPLPYIANFACINFCDLRMKSRLANILAHCCLKLTCCDYSSLMVIDLIAKFDHKFSE